MLSEIKIRSIGFKFKRWSESDVEHPINVEAEFHYHNNPLRTYVLEENWSLAYAISVYRSLRNAIFASYPSSADLDWDY